MSTPKPLKLWNGSGRSARKTGDPLWADLRSNSRVHAYVAAHNRADAIRVIEEYCGRAPSVTEIRDYWHEGAWGNPMKGVVPERGLWIDFNDNGQPVRVL
jgi:hypothetical protein